MLFKKLEMHGFKSFAEPVIIEFNEGITGIVGPNGSGKSNISDAIRWVLGEQSPKMLRGGKMEEVIFNGTSTRKSRGMAEVTLVIDNSDASLPIDYKEVAITRRMFRSGESEYHINGNQCRLRDIRELIMDTGIGVDGYSLIGQGKISEILSNKTESRREIFEEAAGIVAYRSKKAEAERKLASTNANMERLQDIIGEIESRIDGLKEDSAKAKEYLQLREKHKKLEINIILKNVENLDLKNEYAKDDLMNLTCSVNDLDEEKAVIDQRLSEGRNRADALEALSVEAREDLLKVIEELNRAVNKNELDQEKISSIQRNVERIQSEIEAIKERKERESLNRDSFFEEKKQIDEEARKAEEHLQEKIMQYNDLAGQMAEMSEKADQYKTSLYQANARIQSGEAEISSLKVLRESLARRHEVLTGEKASRESDNKDTLDRLNAAKKERNGLAETVEIEKSTKEEQVQALDHLRNEEKKLVRKLEELRIHLGRITARKKTIEEMESNYEGYNYAVKHIMKSGLGGIRGVVAELIRVPQGYETAIETALGASLQNIVCEDDASAKRAIRSLKENRAGRMTFLPLQSVRGGFHRISSLENEPGFIGFGPDCIECDAEYDEIAGYLLGRVVIVDHIDHAVNISKKSKGMRVVTLEGEIINSGGAMTGGRYKNKTANILDRRAEITALSKEIDENNHQNQEVADHLTELRGKISNLSESVTSLEQKIRLEEQELLMKDRDMKAFESALLTIRNSGEKLEVELGDNENQQEESQRRIDELTTIIETSRSEIKQIEEESQSHLSEYDSRKKEFDAISEEITKARIAVTSCEGRRDHAEEMARRIQDSLEEMEADLTRREQQLAALKEEKSSIADGYDNLDELIKEKEEAKANAEEYLHDITEEKSALSAEITEITKEKEEIDQKLKSLQDQKYELELRKAKNEAQLENYKEKLWDDFEVSYIQAMEFRAEDFAMAPAVKENKLIKNRIKALGEVNVGAIKEYETVRERYEFLSEERADIQSALDSLNGIISEMDQTIRTKFKESFDTIVVNFESQFQRLFAGGHAELRLSDSNNPLESDIDIVAQPPGKKLQNINLLSGGEKTLTAIALMFAVLQAKPTPFCILDEVEAALDDANIDRFIDCLRQFHGIQFTLVTHQKSTMEHSDVLYGVTMPEKGVSKVLSLSLEDNLDEYSA